jgi:hypothetical protein
MVFQSAHYKRQEDDDLENNSLSEAAAAASIIKTPAATTIHLPSETPQVRIKKKYYIIFLNSVSGFVYKENPPFFRSESAYHLRVSSILKRTIT